VPDLHDALPVQRVRAPPTLTHPSPTHPSCACLPTRARSSILCRCAKLIIQSRMQEVVYLSDAHRASDSMKASRRMLQLAGVKSWAHTPSSPRIMIDFGSDLAIDRKIDGVPGGK
jgi:hypothetical protein